MFFFWRLIASKKTKIQIKIPVNGYAISTQTHKLRKDFAYKTAVESKKDFFNIKSFFVRYFFVSHKATYSKKFHTSPTKSAC